MPQTWMLRVRVALAVCSASVFWLVSSQDPAIAISPLRHLPKRFSEPSKSIRPEITCPEAVEDLMPLLLRDLPSYTNRVMQRSRSLNRDLVPYNYVLLAGRPEFEPLTLGPGTYSPSATESDRLDQVFFTTLERQYIQGQVQRQQGYHWLFLTKTERGWRLALLFSSFGSYPATQPPSPPEDSSQGAVGQAIRLWLRDCETGNVSPISNL